MLKATWLAAERDLLTILKGLAGRREVSNGQQVQALRVLEDLYGGRRNRELAFPFPSAETILLMLSRSLGVDMLSPYGRYSYFVHPYVTSWTPVPFSPYWSSKFFDMSSDALLTRW